MSQQFEIWNQQNIGQSLTTFQPPQQRVTSPQIISVNSSGSQNTNRLFSSFSRTNSSSCVDSSFKKIFEAENRAYSFLCSEKTRDGGIVIGGFGRNKLSGPPFKWYSIITKFDSIGNHIWSKEIQSDILTSLYIESIKELSDGSIIVSGWHENPLSMTPPTTGLDFFAAKLTTTGDLIWLKTFHSLMGNNCSTSNIRFASVAEGINGDLYIGGTISNCNLPILLVVFKLNSSGILQWKYSFSDSENNSSCLGIYFDGTHVSVISRSALIDQGIVSVNFSKLDPVTGVFISNKAWKCDLPNPASFYAGFLMWTPKSERLSNGNYCVYGQTFGDFVGSSIDLPHYVVLEFNSNHEFVTGYTINSTLAANSPDNKIEVDRFGRAVFTLTTYTNWLSKTKHIGAVDNGSLVHQRKLSFQNLEVNYDNFELFDDGSYAYINTIATPGQDNFYLYYSLLHNSDTSSECLGYQANFSYTKPVSYISYSFTWAQINPNPLIETNNQGNIVIPLNYTGTPPCSEVSFCDTLKIHGNPFLCNLQQEFTFTAFRNNECGGRVNWFIEPSVVQSFQSVNDTTLRIRFNQSWTGWLHAELFSSCGIIKDSLFVAIGDSPGPVNLGPDTVICPANSIRLNAHTGYATYQWNNGSTDSILIANTPGVYYVDVRDACGSFFSDTVLISAAPPIPFSVGPDRNKCNNDTLHLTATSGFINYAWGPVYNISSLTSQQVVVNPSIDTVYFVRGEKTAGCYAYDTIRISVFTSPPINLGPDVSFCSGDSTVLNAGAGFNQYIWNTGSLSGQIIANTTGVYSVTGTTANGCKSYDTLRILNVWANPIVRLEKDTTICEGATRSLHAGSFSNYSWQDGSTGPSINVVGIGLYYVTVTDDNLCVGTDTVRITKLLASPNSFLPPDTSICNYGFLSLKASESFDSYLWSNGSSGAAITVSNPGIYWLQVSDNKQCKGRDTVIVNLKECLTGFFIPSGFTPDNNGKNDVFKPIIGGNVKRYQFMIFNRWGQVLFSTSELTKGWDGTMGGVPQDTNTFIWTCTFQLEGSPPETKKGTVVLIR